MHLVLLNQHYPPDDEPVGLMLAEVAERLVADGHRVTVLCGSGVYHAPGEGAGGSVVGGLEAKSGGPIGGVVRRVWGTRFGRQTLLAQLIDYATFYLGVAWSLVWLRPSPDRIVALTTPPFLSLVARMMSKLRGGDHGHWVMDLYPDVLVAHGILMDGGIGARLLGFLSRWGFGGTRCAFVSAIGSDLAGRVGQYLSAGRSIEVVPLWPTGDRSREQETGVRGQESGDRSQGTGTGNKRQEAGGGSQEDDLRPFVSPAVRAWRESRGWGADELVQGHRGDQEPSAV